MSWLTSDEHLPLGLWLIQQALALTLLVQPGFRRSTLVSGHHHGVSPPDSPAMTKSCFTENVALSCSSPFRVCDLFSLQSWLQCLQPATPCSV